jgi:hypothetical protein
MGAIEEGMTHFTFPAFGAIAAALVALSACADKAPPPLASPDPSYCAWYSPFAYSPAAAAVENVESLRVHIGNESRYADRCLSRQDAPGGPR